MNIVDIKGNRPQLINTGPETGWVPANMGAGRLLPWDLGGDTNERPGYGTKEEMLEAAGLAGWNVIKRPLQVVNGPVAEGRFGTVRQDTGQFLGDVGRKYQVIQMEDAFAFGDQIVDDGEAKWERAGSFRSGRVAFGCMELQHLDIDVPGDVAPLKPYLLIVNSFDGSTPYQGVLAYVRPICENTFEMARGTKTPYRFNIRHTGTLDGKLAMARDAIGIAFRHTAEVKAITERLATIKLVDSQIEEIFSKAIWPLSDTATEGVRENHASTKAFELYKTSETIPDSIRGTAWGAFNAVTEFVDHFAEYKGRKVNEAADIKGEALLFGRGQGRKDRAVAALLKAGK